MFGQTLYAKWQINKVYIQYNMNGGSWAGSGNARFGVNGNTITLDGATFNHGIDHGGSSDPYNYNNSTNGINISRPNYNASPNKVWFTGTSGNGTCYDHNTNYNANDYCNTDSGNCTITLYVNWILDDFVVTLDRGDFTAYGKDIYPNTTGIYNAWKNGGGTIAKKSSSSYYLKDSTTFKIKNGETYGSKLLCDDKVGKSSVYNCIDVSKGKFEGWYTAASGGTRVTSTTVFNEGKNITLYAHWKKYSSSARSSTSDSTSTTNGCSGCCSGHCACCLCCTDSAYWSNQYDNWRS